MFSPFAQPPPSPRRENLDNSTDDLSEEEVSNVAKEPAAKPKVQDLKAIELSSPSIKKPTSRRSSMFLLQREAIKQNNELGGKKYFPPSLEGVDGEVEQLSLTDKKVSDTKDNGVQSITINGIEIALSAMPLATGKQFVAPKRWIRSERSGLDKDVLDVFWKSATGHVLAKNNKLEVMSIKNDDDQLLFQVKNLNTQIKALKNHFYAHDCIEVFTIVVPEDVHSSPRVHPTTFDLFSDYATLHPAMIANSNAWYNNWVTDPAIRENLGICFETFRNNTDASLWSKAYEDHEEFAPFQQGGPLVFYFILKRIMDVSESSIQYLQKRIKALKLSDLPGENVDDAVSLIKSAHKILVQTSTDTRHNVPDDLNETLLRVFQTSTCTNFNEIFAHEEREARRKADKCGGTAEYPSVSTICALATNTYKRLTGPGEEYLWCKPVGQSAAFTTATGPDLRRCFNCDKVGCRPKICKQPLDQDRIKRNADAYAAKKRSSGGSRPTSSRSERGSRSSRLTQRSRDEHGRPTKLNKNGVYVVDQQRYKLQQADEKLKALAAQLPDTSSGTSPATFVADVQAIRAALGRGSNE